MHQSISLFVCSIFFMMYLRKAQENKNEKQKKKLEKERTDKEIEKERKKWKDPLWNERTLFDALFVIVDGKQQVNRNIVPELYNYESWNKESDEEAVWKKRVLLQNTPNGNISMHYDLYRQAFAYYSDNHVSYTVLNQCAMKYVRIFYCRDFFVDTTVLPVTFVSPFNKMKEEEEIRQKEKAMNKRKDLGLNFDTSAFVVSAPNKNKNNIKKVTYKNENTLEIYKNNFRCAGKLSGDWKMLQPAPLAAKRKITTTISDDYDLIKKQKSTSYSLWKTISAA